MAFSPKIVLVWHPLLCFGILTSATLSECHNMSGNLILPFNRYRPWLRRSLIPYLYRPIKSCSQITNEGQQGYVSDVKAPSTADEFRRVAEEKQKAEEEGSSPDQGIPGQTIENASDGSEESGASKVDTGAEETSSEKHKP